jgi:hypothetical protein
MTSKQFFAITLLLCSAGVVLGGAVADSTLADLAGYRQWTRVNDKPITVEYGGSPGA